MQIIAANNSIPHCKYGIIVGSLGFLLPSNTVSKVIELDSSNLCNLPVVPRWLLGVTIIDGYVIPLFDLEILLNIPSSTHTQQYLIIGKGEQAFGIKINNLPQKISIKEQYHLTCDFTLPPVLQPYVSGAYNGNPPWIILDFSALFLAQGTSIINNPH